MKISDRKHEIITIAAKLFKERGYSAVTMRDIAKAMNIKAASLYNHITSKQQILVLIILEIAEEFTQTMNQIFGLPIGTIQKLEKVIQLHIDITIRNRDAIACLNNDWMHLADEELQYFLKMRNDYEENFRKIVKHGIAQKEIAPVNPEVLLFSTLSTLRTLYLWYGKNSNLSNLDLKKDLSKTLLYGIVENA